MVMAGLKRGLDHMTTNDRRGNHATHEQQQEIQTEATNFCILELPVQLICDILSRLPLKTIFRCRSVCQKFLKLISDPYFAKLHFARAPVTTASLILQRGFLYFYMLDLNESSSILPCSTSFDQQSRRCRPRHIITDLDADFVLCDKEVIIVGSCNGLLCLYYSKPMNFYCICNPILDEYVNLPPPTPSTPSCTYLDLSGFGYCPKSKQYKVIRFMGLETVDPATSLVSTKVVAEVHTLGSHSWRRIDNAPCLKIQGSFDPFLNGALHWITENVKPSEIVYSFDLETEQFKPLPSPPHFCQAYINKVSWISIGILRGCLCVCYIYEDAQLEVWVMKDYGMKESWSREFSIDIKFYCGLHVDDLQQPVKFLNNGDLWFVCRSSSLVSYSPQKGSFRDFKVTEGWEGEIRVFIPSFCSLKDAAVGKSMILKSLRLEPSGHIIFMDSQTLLY